MPGFFVPGIAPAAYSGRWFVPANLVRVATGQACRVVLGPGRVKRAARIVRSCCLVRVAQLLPVAAWAVGRAAWAWCRWLPSAAWWLPAALVAQLLPVAAWSRSCCLAVFVFVIQAGPCL